MKNIKENRFLAFLEIIIQKDLKHLMQFTLPQSSFSSLISSLIYLSMQTSF